MTRTSKSWLASSHRRSRRMEWRCLRRRSRSSKGPPRRRRSCWGRPWPSWRRAPRSPSAAAAWPSHSRGTSRESRMESQESGWSGSLTLSRSGRSCSPDCRWSWGRASRSSWRVCPWPLWRLWILNEKRWHRALADTSVDEFVFASPGILRQVSTKFFSYQSLFFAKQLVFLFWSLSGAVLFLLQAPGIPDATKFLVFSTDSSFSHRIHIEVYQQTFWHDSDDSVLSQGLFDTNQMSIKPLEIKY